MELQDYLTTFIFFSANTTRVSQYIGNYSTKK